MPELSVKGTFAYGEFYDFYMQYASSQILPKDISLPVISPDRSSREHAKYLPDWYNYVDGVLYPEDRFSKTFNDGAIVQLYDRFGTPTLGYDTGITREPLFGPADAIGGSLAGKGVKLLGRGVAYIGGRLVLTNGSKIGSLLPRFGAGTSVSPVKMTNSQIGKMGEDVAKNMLAKNGWSDFTYIKNGSDNGIDIIARSVDGRIGIFEVKASSIGKIPSLSAEQSTMGKYSINILNDAANAANKYKNIDSATKQAANNILKEVSDNPEIITGGVIGVDLTTGIIRISRWNR